MITLTRQPIAIQDVIDSREMWPVLISAVFSADDSPAPIFVMQLSPDATKLGDSFSCVASAIQMTDLPAGAPENGSPFYRLHVLQKYFETATAAQEFEQKVQEAVQDLVDNLHSAAQLTEVDNIIIT